MVGIVPQNLPNANTALPRLIHAKIRDMNDDMYDLIVVGAGASGLMAAGIAAERGLSVLVLEKNKELGKKLKITGGGRCNIYNAEFDTKKLLDNYGEAKKFLFSPFSKFAAQESVDFFDRIGLPTVVQARKRAFPETEKAMDVFKALHAYCLKHKVEFKTTTPVTKITKNDQGISSLVSKREKFYAKSYILSTGGYAAPETGSTGDGFRFLEKLGHSIHKPSPNIVPLTTQEAWVHELAGLSLSFMKIRFMQDGKTHIRKTGKILFTHFGISGPLILNAAKEVKALMQGGPVTASIDMFPDTAIGDLDRKIWRLFEQNKNKQIKNVLPELVPKKIAAVVLKLSGIPDKPVNEISKTERGDLARICKDLQFPISGTLGWDKAVIADGGVSLDEIDFTTMQSKLVPNLYILGDLLHINRPSGGYSLQLCWTTAFIAGESV